VDVPDSKGKTPLHVAAGIGYEWGVKALLDANADPTIKDKMNRSVVEYAEQKGKLSCGAIWFRPLQTLMVLIDDSLAKVFI
jgi:ankyrin repeat protein